MYCWELGCVVTYPAGWRTRHDLGVTISHSQHCSCCSGCSPKTGILTPQLSQGPHTCQQLVHQEMASPLFLPTFLPEQSQAQGVATPKMVD